MNGTVDVVTSGPPLPFIPTANRSAREPREDVIVLEIQGTKSPPMTSPPSVLLTFAQEEVSDDATPWVLSVVAIVIVGVVALFMVKLRLQARRRMLDAKDSDVDLVCRGSSSSNSSILILERTHDSSSRIAIL